MFRPAMALKKRAGAGRGCKTGGIFCCNLNWRLPKTPNDLQYKVHIKTPENLIKNHSNHCLYKEFFFV